MNIYDQYYKPNDDTSYLYHYDRPNQTWVQSEKYGIKKVEDHKSICYFFVEMGANVSRDEVCKCQNDIYAIVNKETSNCSAVIMGRRIQNNCVINHIVGDSETYKQTHFNISSFTTNMTDPPTFRHLCLLLIEFLADKNYCMTKYKITGSETEDMLTALKAVGFTFDGEYYTRMPMLGRYCVRY